LFFVSKERIIAFNVYYTSLSFSTVYNVGDIGIAIVSYNSFSPAKEAFSLLDYAISLLPFAIRDIFSWDTNFFLTNICFQVIN